MSKHDRYINRSE